MSDINKRDELAEAFVFETFARSLGYSDIHQTELLLTYKAGWDSCLQHAPEVIELRAEVERLKAFITKMDEKFSESYANDLFQKLLTERARAKGLVEALKAIANSEKSEWCAATASAALTKYQERGE